MAYRHQPGVYDTKFQQNRDRRVMEDMLSEWYGKDFAAVEVTNRTEKPVKLADSLDEVLAECLTEKTGLIVQLQEEWHNIIAPPLNKFTTFGTIKDSVIYIEVSHPAFLSELRKPAVTASWLKKINSAVPGLELESAFFVPAGQYREKNQ